MKITAEENNCGSEIYGGKAYCEDCKFTFILFCSRNVVTEENKYSRRNTETINGSEPKGKR